MIYKVYTIGYEEMEDLGIPYQTLISSILHRFVQGELVDKKSPDLAKLIKSVSYR